MQESAGVLVSSLSGKRVHRRNKESCGIDSWQKENLDG